MPECLKPWLEKLAAVKEGSGVVGKLCKLGYFAFAAIAVGLWKMPDAPSEVAQLVLAAIALIVLAFLLFAAGSLWLAWCNPLAANMVSGDHVKALHRQRELARRGQPASVPTANVPAPQAEMAEIAPPPAEQAEVVREPAQ